MKELEQKAWDHLGMCQLVHEPVEALSHFENMRRLARERADRPGELDALVRLCYAAHEAGQYGQMSDFARQGLELAPEVTPGLTANFRALRGRARLELGNAEGAREDLVTAVSELEAEGDDANHRGALADLCVALEQLGELEKAASQLDRFLETLPVTPGRHALDEAEYRNLIIGAELSDLRPRLRTPRMQVEVTDAILALGELTTRWGHEALAWEDPLAAESAFETASMVIDWDLYISEATPPEAYAHVDLDAVYAPSSVGQAQALLELDRWVALNEMVEDTLVQVRAVDDPELTIEFLLVGAEGGRRVGEYEDADSAIQGARELCGQVDDPEIVAWVDAVQAELALDRGRLEEARALLGEAEARLPEDAPEATHLLLGRIRARFLFVSGDRMAAENTLTDALERARRASLPLSATDAALDLAQLWRGMGRWREAWEVAESARSRADAVGLVGQRQRAEILMAQVAADAGDIHTARLRYRSFFEDLVAGQADPPEQAVSFEAMIEAFRGIPVLFGEEGFTPGEMLVEIAELQEDPTWANPLFRGALLETSAAASRATGEIAEARVRLRNAVRLYEDLGQRPAIARARTALAEVELERGRPRAASRSAAKALALAEQQAAPQQRLRSHYLHGQALEAVGREGRALQQYEKAEEIVTSLSGQVRLDDAGWAYTEQRSTGVYDAGLRLMAKRASRNDRERSDEDVRAAYRLAEERSARVLWHQSQRVGLERLERFLPANLAEEERQFVALADLEATARVRDLTVEEVARRESLETERAEFVAALRADPRFASYAELRHPPAPDPGTLVLAPDEVMIRFAVVDDAVLRWVVRRGNIVSFDRIPVTRAELARRIGRVTGAWSQPTSPTMGGSERGARRSDSPNDVAVDGTDARELSELLIADVVADIQEGGRLVIVPDGPLAGLPFEALPVERGDNVVFLGLELPISYAPSGRFLSMVRHRELVRADFEHDLLAVGNPRFNTSVHDDVRVLLGVDGSVDTEAAIASRDVVAGMRRNAEQLGLLSPLPYSGEEVTTIGVLFPESGRTILTGSAASKEAVLGHLDTGTYRHIHFATHGILPDRVGCPSGEMACIQEPALVLSAPHDGGLSSQLLGLRDIMERQIHARIVVLSACRTGEGESVHGEGVLGMGQAFLYAGAGSVMMSLWEVSDPATAEWMTRFYSALSEGRDPAVAALEARQHVARAAAEGNLPDWSHPFYWAPFILVGSAY